AAVLGVLEPDQGVRVGLCVGSRRPGHQLDLPHAVASVAARLLDDPDAVSAEAGRKALGELLDRFVAIGVGTPPQVPGLEEDLFGPHLGDDIGMGRDPHPMARHLPQQGVQPGPGRAVLDGIDPHHHAVEGQQLFPNLGHGVVGIDHGLGGDVQLGEGCEQGAEHRLGARRHRFAVAVTPPQQADLATSCDSHSPLPTAPWQRYGQGIVNATVVALRSPGPYPGRVSGSLEWVMLAYRLPREPSSPRVVVWRRLRRLGAVQLVDGLAVLPADARTREQFDWLAEQVVDAGGEATTWVARAGSARQERELARRMADEAARDYRAVIADAAAAAGDLGTAG